MAGGDEIQRLVYHPANVPAGAVPVDLDQIEMRQAIDQAGGGYLADAAKIIFVNLVDASPDKLTCAVRHAVEHLVRIVEVMNRAQNEIEPVPVFLDPGAAGRGRFRIVVEFNT